jgi:hypothetical protein
MPVRVACPSCHKTLQVPDAVVRLGKRVRCPSCKTVLDTPKFANTPHSDAAGKRKRKRKIAKCDDCGGSVSKRATACPHCGAPAPASSDALGSTESASTELGEIDWNTAALEEYRSPEASQGPRKKKKQDHSFLEAQTRIDHRRSTGVTLYDAETPFVLHVASALLLGMICATCCGGLAFVPMLWQVFRLNTSGENPAAIAYGVVGFIASLVGFVFWYVFKDQFYTLFWL